MGSTHIEVVGSESRLAGKVRAASDSLRRVCDDVAALKAIMDTYIGAAVPFDYAALAAGMGWAAGAESEARAQAVYALIAAADAKLGRVADIVALRDRLG